MNFSIGAEVITCALSKLPPDSYGNHRHDDPCFEVRTVVAIDVSPGTVVVTDLLLGRALAVSTESVMLAPYPLLRRKVRAFLALTKIIRGWEHLDHGSAHVLLDRLIIEVDRYLFCPECATRERGPATIDVVAERRAREAFEEVASLVAMHKRDQGDGWNRSGLLREIVQTLEPALEALGGAVPLIKHGCLAK